MKLPNWVKVCYWLVLTGGASWVLYQRYTHIISGSASPADALLLLIWLALVLVPIFQDVNIFGLHLKQEVKEAEKKLSGQIMGLRSDIQNSIRVSTQNINYVGPLPDAELRKLREEAKRARPSATQPAADLPIDPDALDLFRVRLNLEKELRRIWEVRFPDAQKRVPVPIILTGLSEANLITPSLANSARELYAVSSRAIHGEKPTSEQLEFGKELGPKVISLLKGIS